jgi:hypothetical protein
MMSRILERDFNEKTPLTEAALPEYDADPPFFAPYDMTRQMQSIAGHIQYEPLGDSDLVGYLQRRASGG